MIPRYAALILQLDATVFFPKGAPAAAVSSLFVRSGPLGALGAVLIASRAIGRTRSLRFGGLGCGCGGVGDDIVLGL